MTTWGLSSSGAALHQDALVWDMTFPFSELCGSDAQHVDTLFRMAASGYNFVSLTVAGDKGGIEPSIRRIAGVLGILRAHPDRFMVCAGVDDILAAKAAGKLGIGLHFQGTDAFGRDINMVEVYYRLGIRSALMAYNQRNSVGDGCHERTDSGLSRFGLQLITEMNRVGMLVDCTHTGYRTTMEAIEASTSPCMFSHSSARALVDHERNIRDDQIKACAAKGGVIGVNGVGLFIGENDASTETLLRQIDYIVSVAGPAHVGLGMDFVSDVPTLMAVVKGNPARYPKGEYRDPTIEFVAPEQMPEVTEGLLKRGYSESDVRGILGENFLRLARQVWK